MNGGLRIDKGYWGNRGFWLRAPSMIYSDHALAARLVHGIAIDNYVPNHLELKPAFELNLSSVIFASAAPAASSDGELSENDAFTLRYDASKHSKTLGSALVSYDKGKVTLTNVPSGTYLVVQNSDGAWAKQIKTETVTPGDIDSSLDSFQNCKVWLETMDDGITYAALASEEKGYSVEVTGSTGLSITSNNGAQEVAPGAEIQLITVTADKGYYFPENYPVEAQNGISVTRESYTRLKISGTPTADVNITLLPATEKTDRTDKPNVTGGVGLAINSTDETMEYAESATSDSWTACTAGSTQTGAGTWYVRYKETDTQKASPAKDVEVIAPTYTITVNNASLDFGAQNEGYGSVAGRPVTIKNTGNSKVTLKEPISSNYGVSLSDNKIEPNQEVELTVSPNPGLGAGSYDETIVIQTEQGTSATLDVSFKVNGALEVSLAASPKEIVEGQSATLTAEAQGGSGTYAYTWHVDGVENASLTGSEVTVYPTATTTYKVVVTDTIEGKNATATVTVVPKSYKLEVPADIAFEQHIGDTKAGAERVSIKNTGNVDVTNISAVLSEANANVFTLDTTGMQTTLSPSGETAFSVTPNAAGLAAGTYKAEAQITGDAGVQVTAGITLKITDHEWEDDFTVDKEPTCTENGSRSIHCKNCDTIKGSEVLQALGHDFGEWKVTKEPTAAEQGERVRQCSRCNTEEKLTIPVLEHKPGKDKPDEEQKPVKPDKDAPQTGDTNNVWLWFILAAVSGSLLTVTAAYRRKQKRTNKRNCRHSRGM